MRNEETSHSPRRAAEQPTNLHSFEPDPCNNGQGSSREWEPRSQPVIPRPRHPAISFAWEVKPVTRHANRQSW